MFEIDGMPSEEQLDRSLDVLAMLAYATDVTDDEDDGEADTMPAITAVALFSWRRPLRNIALQWEIDSEGSTSEMLNLLKTHIEVIIWMRAQASSGAIGRIMDKVASADVVSELQRIHSEPEELKREIADMFARFLVFLKSRNVLH